ncbi:ROK family transcriptional regulator [Clostridiaceae bacterium 35-E11]
MTTKRKGVNHTSLKIQNQMLLIQEIKHAKGMSRAEAAKKLGLSAPSVSSNIEDLIDRGIITEKGIGESNGGRKPIVLEYNYEYGYVIGLALKTDVLSGVISNLAGEIQYRLDIKEDLTTFVEEELFNIIQKSIDQMLRSSSIDRKYVKCIVLSLPGIISDNNIQVSNIFPVMKGNHLFQFLKDTYATYVMIKNDINTEAVGEYWKLQDKNLKNIIYISAQKEGIGSGIIIDGCLYEGSRYGAGEIGYMLLNTEFLRDKKADHAQDYFERVLSHKKILKYAFDLAMEKGGYIKTVTQGNFCDMNMEIFKGALEQEDKVALETLDIVARYYTALIHNMSVILNPEMVILSGFIREFGSVFTKAITKYVHNISIIPIDIRFSQLGDMVELYGCMYFGIEYVHKNILFI